MVRTYRQLPKVGFEVPFVCCIFDIRDISLIFVKIIIMYKDLTSRLMKYHQYYI